MLLHVLAQGALAAFVGLWQLCVGMVGVVGKLVCKVLPKPDIERENSPDAKGDGKVSRKILTWILEKGRELLGLVCGLLKVITPIFEWFVHHCEPILVVPVIFLVVLIPLILVTYVAARGYLIYESIRTVFYLPAEVYNSTDSHSTFRIFLDLYLLIRDLLNPVQQLLQPVQQLLNPVQSYPMGSLCADIPFS